MMNATGYFQGDAIRHTGNEVLHGGVFYEAVLLEGAKEGKTIWVATGPASQTTTPDSQAKTGRRIADLPHHRQNLMTCGIHGDSTTSGRCESCDRERQAAYENAPVKETFVQATRNDLLRQRDELAEALELFLEADSKLSWEVRSEARSKARVALRRAGRLS